MHPVIRQVVFPRHRALQSVLSTPETKYITRCAIGVSHTYNVICLVCLLYFYQSSPFILVSIDIIPGNYIKQLFPKNLLRILQL